MISAAGDETLGFSIRPKKFFKKVGRAAGKVGKVAGKVGKAVGKVALLPLTLQLRLLTKLMIPFAKGVCAVPEPILRVGATSAGVNFNIVPVFCQAVQVRNMGQIRKLLPPMIKLGVKVAATTAVPGLGPVLQIAKFIPGLSQFAGADTVATDEVLGLLDATPIHAIAGAIDEMSDAELKDALGINTGAGLILALSGLSIGTGLFFAFRK